MTSRAGLAPPDCEWLRPVPTVVLETLEISYDFMGIYWDLSFRPRQRWLEWDCSAKLLRHTGFSLASIEFREASVAIRDSKSLDRRVSVIGLYSEFLPPEDI